MLPIQLHLKEDFFHDYLLFYFRYKPGKQRRKHDDMLRNQIVLRSSHDIGKMIISNLVVSNTIKKSHGTNLITLYLPDLHSDLSYKPIYFDEAATIRINKYIEAYFYHDFRDFCISGNEKGIRYDIIIRSFIRLFNLHKSVDIYERLKKRDYRRRLEWDNYLVQGYKTVQDETYIDENQ